MLCGLKRLWSEHRSLNAERSRSRRTRGISPFAIRYSLFAVSAPLSLFLLGALPDWAATGWTYILLILGFSLVIFVHELGHFLAAKWAGVRVERFAIGFGKELIGFTKGETRYSFNVLPLGGYVKMLGQEDFVVDKTGELKVKDDPNSFTNKSVGQRMVIISAGVIMNLLFAAIAFGIVVMVGRLQPPAVVGQVIETSAAGRAGLQTGDRILAVNGTKVESFQDLTARITLSDMDEKLVLDIERDGRALVPPPEIIPEYKKDAKVRQIGISPGMNLRVAAVEVTDEFRPDKLHRHDLLLRLVKDGREIEYKDLGQFRRAIVDAQGEPVEIIVSRPKDPEALTLDELLKQDAQVESTTCKVRVQALWAPIPFDADDAVNGSLLGLIPRMTVLYCEPKKSFEKAGAEPGDVIARIGPHDYPSYSELKKIIEESEGQELSLDVRRTLQANGDLSAAAVAFCVQHRETLIAVAREDVSKVLPKVQELAKAEGLPTADLEKITTALAAAKDASSCRRWLEQVDIHHLKPLMPSRAFSLLGGGDPPTVDASFRCIDEDHLVVADVLPKLGDRESPAARAGIPAGSVILSVNGAPVRRWHDLSKAFRANAGKTVDVGYRVVDEVRTAKFDVPQCIIAALNLQPGARIISIDGKTAFPVKGADGQIRDLSLPDWRALYQALNASVGKSVTVEFVTSDGRRNKAQYSVTADNVDPWLARVVYVEPFLCYPLQERHRVTNPIAAIGVGFRQAYQATVQTVLSIRHMLITQQIGLSKVSGPVGIVRLGSRFADSGMLDLLWFLAVISANLAVINFLPMPIVDGGLFLFLILEKIRGEPISIKTQVVTQLVGIALIATLFILVTYQDIKNWITGA